MSVTAVRVPADPIRPLDPPVQPEAPASAVNPAAANGWSPYEVWRARVLAPRQTEPQKGDPSTK